MRSMRLLTWTRHASVVVSIVVLGVWSLADPGPRDAKCPRYVLWKCGLWPFDADVVYGSMANDRKWNTDALVVGLTADELESRFERLRSPSEDPWLRGYVERDFPGRDLRGLGASNWAVELVNGRAVRLHLLKG